MLNLALSAAAFCAGAFIAHLEKVDKASRRPIQGGDMTHTLWDTLFGLADIVEETHIAFAQVDLPSQINQAGGPFYQANHRPTRQVRADLDTDEPSTYYLFGMGSPTTQAISSCRTARIRTMEPTSLRNNPN